MDEAGAAQVQDGVFEELVVVELDKRYVSAGSRDVLSAALCVLG